jgi:hypothetical protein
MRMTVGLVRDPQANEISPDVRPDRETLRARQDSQYCFLTEFQSHEPEFDYLKSLEIEEKINCIRCPYMAPTCPLRPGGCHLHAELAQRPRRRQEACTCHSYFATSGVPALEIRSSHV